MTRSLVPEQVNGRHLAHRRLGFTARLMGAALVVLSVSGAYAQATYPSPDAAANALVDALAGGDSAALKRVLGSHFQYFIPMQDYARGDIYDFLGAWSQGHEIVNDPAAGSGQHRAHLVVGKSNWALPIPLVETSQGWRFDPAAGLVEMQLRRVGRNERAAMLTSLAYLEAQKDYYNLTNHYAMRFVSTPGKRDGLYWPTAPGETQSPLGPLAAAMPTGNKLLKDGYHGYHYRILTAQGTHAKEGVQNYVQGDVMTKGYALVAWPVKYGTTGVMSFMVNQDGQLYEKNLGPQSERIAAALKSFNPDKTWSPVQP